MSNQTSDTSNAKMHASNARDVRHEPADREFSWLMLCQASFLFALMQNVVPQTAHAGCSFSMQACSLNEEPDTVNSI